MSLGICSFKGIALIIIASEALLTFGPVYIRIFSLAINIKKREKKEDSGFLGNIN